MCTGAMAAALYAFIAAMIAGIGARDQLLVAGLAVRLGRRWSILLVALASAMFSTAVAVLAARAISAELNNRAGLLLAALALALAALELALVQPRRAPDEPTRSLGAAGIVLLATQITDATRFLVFAIAIATEAPRTAGLGGMIASLVVITVGWVGGADLLALPLKSARRVLAAMLMLVAIWLVWQVAMQ
jgi:putative Ca2+/H+ antiporter (TMEM165/GDT1 family)